ncbi:alpha/beta hydrolase [Gilvimarinus sp. SDUM040013]|uniref:Alpha/beta hydrolase n=1 Tax=Gilvimarinus gilvus TaxID=3058038 RepID=A0ABU4RXG3_9GAMM|nr:alpha/beta hydrolase [Gilvimarinus sp. SDUM040013]MDO3388689.1 alpha/beta hydrolase [Gilvimarinus sp. SDUM040013]MDX6849584.1 alpha/beta hydrolase [Gilvimarinus sp. SDUM040013]
MEVTANTLTINGLTHCYYRQLSFTANAPLYIAIPGGPGLNHALFRPALENLNGEVIYFDPPGTGSSSALCEQNNTFNMWLGHIEAFVKNIADRPVVIICHSASVIVATKLASTLPNVVDKLVIISPVLGGPDSLIKYIKESSNPQYSAVAKALWLQKSVDALPEYLQHVFPMYDPQPAPPSVLNNLTFNADLFFTFVDAWLKENRQLNLGILQQRCLVILGDSDPFNHRINVNHIAHQLASAQQVSYTNAGHNLMLHHSERLTQDIEKFVSACS